MKSLQNKYNLIKEGKGNKELFLKEAKTLFPNVVTNVLTYDQAIHNLKERGIISEGSTNVSDQNTGEPNWFKIFKENVVDLKEGDIKQAIEFYNKNQHLGTKAVAEKFGVEEADLMKALGQTPGDLFESVDVKATLKQTDKSVEDKETAGYDYKEKNNNNNISTAEILKGYYAEMKDPKNADKTEEELKKIVFKNLEKDPMYYVKNGEFGIKDIGYTEDAPGLGATKEVKGKYKSSGMEPVKLTESKSKIKAGDIIKHKLTGAKIKVKSIAGSNIEGTYVELGDMEGKVKKGDTIKTNVNLIGKTYELNEGIYDLTQFHKGSFSTGRPDFNKMTADQIEAYLEKDKDNPGGLFGRSLSIVQYILNKKREEEKLKENYGSSDGDFDAQEEDRQMAYYNYDKGMEAYSEGDYLKADRYYTAALRYGSYLGWTEYDLPPYGNDMNESLDETDITGIAGSDDEEDYKKGTKGVKKQKIKEYGEATGEVTFEYIFDEVEYEGEIYNIEATISAEIEDDDLSSSHPDDPTPTVQKTVAWEVDSLDSVERYNAATQEYVPATLSFDDKERLKKLVETSIEYKDMVVDKALDAYYSSEELSEEVEEKTPKKQLMPNKQKGIADAIEVKSTLEKIAGEVWKESDLKKAKEIVQQYLEDSKVNTVSKKKMLNTTELIQNKAKLDVYIANALLKYEKLSVNEGILTEVLNNNIPDFLKDMIGDAIEDSKNGYVVHIEYAGAGRYRISDWFDSDNTVYSVEDGRVLLDRTKEIDAEGNWEEDTLDEKQKNMTTLSEAKKRAIEKHLKEIEKLSEIAAMDHKIQKLQEKIEELKNKLTMTEGDDFVGMVDKNAVKEIKKDIAFLEKRKKIAEAQKGKLAKRVSGESKPQTGTGGTSTTGMMEAQPTNIREMIKNVISSRKHKK